MKRKLPVHVEHTIGFVAMERTRRSMEFEAKVRTQGRVTCEVGCTACCHYPIEISLFEAMSLYRTLVAKGRWTPTFKAGLEMHAKSVALLAPQVWLLSRIPCPLLEKDRCVVYEGRPFVCRTLLSLGDPYDCDPHRFSRNTRLAARETVANLFETFETEQSKKVQTPAFRAPISRALLFAEKLTNGELDLDGLFLAFYEDYKDSQ